MFVRIFRVPCQITTTLYFQRNTHNFKKHYNIALLTIKIKHILTGSYKYYTNSFHFYIERSPLVFIGDNNSFLTYSQKMDTNYRGIKNGMIKVF